MSNLPPGLPPMLPPLLRDQRKIDIGHLKLLSIFHYVAAGLSLFGILFVLLHFTMMHAILGNPKMWEGQKQAPPMEIFAMFKWFYLLLGAWFLASLVLNIISGLCIHRRKNRTFSLVTAAVNCLHVPIGTVLGVFTFIVLLRDSVEELYEAQTTEAHPS